jgi:hypothetical protein
MEPEYFLFPPREPRKLADAGGAKTISEAKRWLVENWRECFGDCEVVNSVDLITVGRAKMRGLVRQGYARPVFEPCDDKGGSWVVTERAWGAEFIRHGGQS